MQKRLGNLVICTLYASLALLPVEATALYEIESLDVLIDKIVAMERIEENDAAEIVYHLKRLSENLDEAIARLSERSEYRPSEALADALALNAARELTAGRIDRALYGFLGASRLTPDNDERDTLRLRAAAAAIEIGEHERALELAISVESEAGEEDIRERASVIGIRAVSHLRGRSDALERIGRLEPRSALGLYQWYLLERNDELHDRIAGSFPDSLIAALIDNTVDVRHLPVPSSFLAPRDEPIDYVDSAEGDRTDKPVIEANATGVVAGLQLGSYRHEPYAVAYRERLQDDGYDAAVITSRDGHYQVVIDFKDMRSREYAQELLLELRDAGYEGFVRYSIDD